MKNIPANVLPVTAIVTAVCLWGGSFSAMKVAVSTISPWTVMWLRMVLALAVMLPFAARLRPRAYRRGDWRPLLLLTLLQPCLYFLLESHALQLTTSSQAGVISATVPLMVVLGARLALAERMPARAVGGLVLSVFGVAWLTLAGSATESASNPLLGNLLELGAMASAAAYMVLIKRLSARYSTWTLTVLQTLGGAVFFLPGAAAVIRGDWLGWSSQQFLVLVFLGVGATLGAFGLYNWGMSRIEAGRASAFINLIPVVAVLLGRTLLGESLNPSQITAAGRVFPGIWLSPRSPRRRHIPAVCGTLPPRTKVAPSPVNPAGDV